MTRLTGRIRSGWLACSAGVLAVVALGAAATVVSAGKANESLSDQEISDQVEDELLFDQAVDSANVDVNTSDGIVTLTGDVESLLAQERAARVAGTVKGVRSVVNRTTVETPLDRSDAEIKQDVERALLSDPATESFEVDVEVDGGVVTLTGTLDSWQERELTKAVAKSVKGVLGIESDLSIDFGEVRPDSEIADEVKRAMENDVRIDAFGIDVAVDDGNVSLSGIVGSATERSQAEREAWVQGVRSVDTSDLEVKDWARDPNVRKRTYVAKPASEIRQAVLDALLYDPRVASFKIDVDMDGSLVTLRGTVDNLKAKRAARQDAQHTVGVSSVVNRIKVRPEDRIDSEIAENVRDALLRDVVVERYDMTVRVRNGVVDLYGTVDTFYEKRQADDVVSRVPGVVDVDNNLVVEEDYEPYAYDPYVDDDSPADYEWYDYDEPVTLKSDAEIADDIESEMWWSPFVDGDEVTVSVDDGVAKLEGTVDTWSERSSAAENAIEGGAVSVINELEVR